MMMLMMMLMMIMIKSQLEFTPLTELDYGTFLCWAANSIGRSLSFSLSLSSLSSWPTSVSSTSSSPCKGLEILGRVKLGLFLFFVFFFGASMHIFIFSLSSSSWKRRSQFVFNFRLDLASIFCHFPVQQGSGQFLVFNFCRTPLLTSFIVFPTNRMNTTNNSLSSKKDTSDPLVPKQPDFWEIFHIYLWKNWIVWVSDCCFCGNILRRKHGFWIFGLGRRLPAISWKREEM